MCKKCNLNWISERCVLAAYKPLGVVPGKVFDASKVARIDADKFRTMAHKLQKENFAVLAAGDFLANTHHVF